MKTNQVENIDQLLVQYFNNTSEKIVFVDKYGQVIAMNKAAHDIISPDNDYQEMTNTICSRCDGYTNEYDLQSCTNCFLEADSVGNTSFQVFMKTTLVQLNLLQRHIKLLMKQKILKHLHYKMFHLK